MRRPLLRRGWHVLERDLEKFDKLNVWTRGAERAPHKPLLVLSALGKWSRREPVEMPFREVDADLTALLREFGSPRQAHHPEYPFWRLQNDGVWQVDTAAPLESRQSNNGPKKSELLKYNVCGRFTDDVISALQDDPGVASEIARHLLGSSEWVHQTRRADWE